MALELKLFALEFQHYSEKDSAEGITGYVIAVADRDVLEHLRGDACWDGDDTIDVWSDDLAELVEVSLDEKILRERGDWYAEPSDLHYGFRHNGWSEGKPITREQADTLVELGVATDLTAPIDPPAPDKTAG